MNEEQSDTPFGVLLTATYYIFISTYFFVLASYYTDYSNYDVLPITILTFIGIFFVILGWGILTFKKWAYYTMLISSLFLIIMIMVSMSIFQFSISFFMFIFCIFSQLGVLIYIVPKSELFGITPPAQPSQPHHYQDPTLAGGRICPDCKRNIPFNSLICPYCQKKFKSYL